jgi:hypothetical protein
MMTGTTVGALLALAAGPMPEEAPPAATCAPPPSITHLDLPPPAAPHPRRTRLLWAVGVQAGAGNDQFTESFCCTLGPGEAEPRTGPNDSVTQPGVGPYLRLGVQMNDFWAIAGETSAGSVNATAYYLRGAIEVEATPHDWLTIALGPAVRADGLSQSSRLSCTLNSCTGTVEALGGTARLDLHLFPASSGDYRSALTLGVSLDVGETAGSGVRQSGPAVAGYLDVGFARY